VSQLHINSNKLKHEVTRKYLLILYNLMCFLWQNKLFLVHLITSQYNVINTVKSVEASLQELSEFLPKFLRNQNLWGCAFNSCIPRSYTTDAVPSAFQTVSCFGFTPIRWRGHGKVMFTTAADLFIVGKTGNLYNTISVDSKCSNWWFMWSMTRNAWLKVLLQSYCVNKATGVTNTVDHFHLKTYQLCDKHDAVITTGGGIFFKVGGHKCKSKNYREILWFELAIVTSQALKCDVINFCQHV